MFKKLSICLVGVMTLTACTTTGNIERNAALGAGIGAVAGAVIGNNFGGGDASTGAAIGAAVGGTAGAARGYEKDQEIYEDRIRAAETRQKRYYDSSADRYYYFDQETGKTYWTNGQVRK